MAITIGQPESPRAVAVHRRIQNFLSVQRHNDAKKIPAAARPYSWRLSSLEKS